MPLPLPPPELHVLQTVLSHSQGPCISSPFREKGRHLGVRETILLKKSVANNRIPFVLKTEHLSTSSGQEGKKISNSKVHE